MAIYYNDNNPFVCGWLKNLIAAKHLPEGDVDERDIRQVKPEELRGYEQVHLFAGIGGWALALQLAGWPKWVNTWTASCPCQPFSNAGDLQKTKDPRHLWPEVLRLARVRRPSVIVGEQVASLAGREWLARVRLDLEALGHAVGAADLCAPSVGAQHIRQRIFWVSHASSLDGGSHDLLEPSSTRRAPKPAGRFPRVRMVKTRWYEDQGFTAKPLLVPNADGVSASLAGIGNAIVPQVAAEFLKAALACLP